MMKSQLKKSLALALVSVLPASVLAVSETRKITTPSQQVPLPSLETTTVTAFEHPTVTHIPVEEISAISEIMDKEDEVATEELDRDFLTASDQ
jgi:hypothetical protein